LLALSPGGQTALRRGREKLGTGGTKGKTFLEGTFRRGLRLYEKTGQTVGSTKDAEKAQNPTKGTGTFKNQGEMKRR